MRTIWSLAGAFALGCGARPLDPSLLPADEAILLVTEPAAAAFLPTGDTTVRGEVVGLADVRVGGEAARVDGTAFEATIPLARGIETIEVSGVDVTGHRVYKRVSVMAGAYADATGPIDRGASIRVNEGGLDAATDLVAGLVDVEQINADLTSMNPVYEDSYSILFWQAVEVEADLSRIDFREPRIALTPKAGEVDIEVSLPDLFVEVPVRGSIVGIDFDVTCSLAADDVVIGGALALGTDGNGHLTAELRQPTVELRGFWFDTSLLPGEIESWLLSDTVRGVTEDLLVDSITEMVPPLLEEQLGSLELAFETDLFGKTLTVEGGFDEVRIDRDGLQLDADIEVGIPGASKKSSPGFLAANAGDPEPSTAPDLAVVLSDDLMNRLLHDVWKAGLLDLQLSTADGSLDPLLLADLGATSEASITLDARLPPVLLQDGDDAVLQLGELDCTIETPGGLLGDRLVITLAGQIPLDIEIEDSAMKLGLGSPELVMMVRESDWGAANETLTTMLESAVPIDSLLVLLGALEIPLPTIGDLTLPDAHVDRDETGTWTTIEVEL